MLQVFGGAGIVCVLMTAGCASAPVAEVAPFTWPASLVVVGNGFPAAGDPCRTVGESAATSEYLDHTARLVGCPGRAESPSVRKLIADSGARVVGEVDGVTLVSVPER